MAARADTAIMVYKGLSWLERNQPPIISITDRVRAGYTPPLIWAIQYSTSVSRAPITMPIKGPYWDRGSSPPLPISTSAPNMPDSCPKRLTGGSAKTVAQELERRAQVFAERPYALQMFPTGDASTQESLMTLEGDGVVLTACKASRDGGYILRFHNNTGADAECLCKLPGMGIEETLRFGPYQIRTCRLTAGRLETCEQFEI